MIRSKLPARYFPLGDTVDLNRVISGPPSNTTLDLVHQGHAKRESALSGPLAEEEPFWRGKCAREGHEVKLDTMSKFVNPCLNRLFVQPGDDGLMSTDYEDLYPKRPLFKEWVAAAKAKLGARNNAAVAPIMGYTASTLNKMLGKSPTHKPSAEALKLLGDFLGRDYRFLLHDPGSPPPGIPADRWAAASEQDQMLALEILEDLQKFPAEEKEAYKKLWKQVIAIGRARIENEKIPKRLT
jgi:transcriptional regulator with XRE-family HTH domain